MLAILDREVLGAVRSAATTEEERFWAAALEHASRALLVAARDIIDAAAAGELDEALDAYARRIEVIENSFLLSQSLDNLQRLTGTARIATTLLAGSTQRIDQVRDRLDPEDSRLVAAIEEGFLEKIRLGKIGPLAGRGGVEEPSILTFPGGVAFRGDFVVRIVKGLLLVLAMGRALALDPTSQAAKRIYERLYLTIREEVEQLTARLGLGASEVLRVENDELLETAEEYEAIPGDVLDSLLEKNEHRDR